jgi:hypothetical protein
MRSFGFAALAALCATAVAPVLLFQGTNAAQAQVRAGPRAGGSLESFRSEAQLRAFLASLRARRQGESGYADSGAPVTAIDSFAV